MVSHVKLDGLNGSKLRFGGQNRKFKKKNFAENARFFDYYVRILAFGDNLMGRSVIKNHKLSQRL